MGSEPSPTTCAWCRARVAGGEGYRLYDRAGGREAAFCRLEHVSPWAFNEGEWPAPGTEPGDVPAPAECAECGSELGGSALLLVRHRGEHRIPDGFCSLDHLNAWAKAGGRWR